MDSSDIWNWSISLVVFFLIFVLPIILAVTMARKKKRSVAVWVVLVVLCSWLAILVLAFLGKKNTAEE